MGTNEKIMFGADLWKRRKSNARIMPLRIECSYTLKKNHAMNFPSDGSNNQITELIDSSLQSALKFV